MYWTVMMQLNSYGTIYWVFIYTYIFRVADNMFSSNVVKLSNLPNRVNMWIGQWELADTFLDQKYVYLCVVMVNFYYCWYAKIMSEKYFHLYSLSEIKENKLFWYKHWLYVKTCIVPQNVANAFYSRPGLQCEEKCKWMVRSNWVKWSTCVLGVIGENCWKCEIIVIPSSGIIQVINNKPYVNIMFPPP